MKTKKLGTVGKVAKSTLAKRTIKALSSGPSPVYRHVVLGLGTTAVGAGMLANWGMVQFTELKKCGKVGRTITNKDIPKDAPVTNIMFITSTSAYNLAKQINGLAHELKKKEEALEASMKKIKKMKKPGRSAKSKLIMVNADGDWA